MTRRELLKLLAAAVPAWGVARAVRAAEAAPALPDIASGPFIGTRESLAAYRAPQWFNDAKLGIWAHWGPQSAAEYGDWYARNMYIQGNRQYDYHVEHYGHPSKFGYKDLIPTWTGDQFDPDYLVGLYKKAGAKYFVSMGVHVDNFDLWNSKHTRWNAVNMGVKRDVVAEFGRAARRHGLRFGVSDHLWCSYKWFSTSHGSDKEGSLAGVPYDGADPAYADLYGDCPTVYRNLPWNEDDIPEKWQRHWFARIKDLVDQSQPDLIYQDGQIPFGELGLSLLAHYYNQNARQHGGQVEAVYTSKEISDSADGTCVLDVERGTTDNIWPRPWQTCTCVGKWHYDRTAEYKSPKRIIDMLVDIVSRNGNLLLNFPLSRVGALDDREMKILDEITTWMDTNGQAIHCTRPWKIFGEGPTVQTKNPKQKYAETSYKDLTAADVRFTTKGQVLYAICMGWPETGRAVIPALAKSRGLAAGRIERVELLGRPETLDWTLADDGLTVKLPSGPTATGQLAIALKIEGLDV
jgi:alpha-L-fucosidase